MSLRPVSEIRITQYLIPAWDGIPNTSIQNKPLLIYHGVWNRSPSSCGSTSIPATELASHLESVGAVVPQWQYTMYRESHFHSTTHELLAVLCGRARIRFGGEDNPARIDPVVEAGDVMIVPAGVAHRLLEDQSGGAFKMLGCYPPGREWDMCSGDDGEEDKVANIAQLPWFQTDPLYGADGPAVSV
jgi:uncharacterized protein YjlB